MRHRRFRNAVERVGHGAHQFDDAFPVAEEIAVKFKAAFRGKSAQLFEVLAIGRGVELGRHDDHRLLRQRRAEGGELALDDFEIVHRVAIVRIARIHQMRDQPRALDVLQEADAQPDAFVRAFDQARHIGDHKRAAIARRRVGIGGNDAQVRLERGERIRGDLRPRRGDARNQRRFSCVRETDQADIGEQLQFEPQMALFAGPPVFVFARRLMPRPHEMRIAVAAPAAPAASRAESLARLGEIEKLLARSLRRKTTVPTGTLRIMSSPDRPWQFEPSPWRPRSARNSRL